VGGAGVSEANGVLRNHYHPPGATIYIEKRLTNQSYRLFSQPLPILLWNYFPALIAACAAASLAIGTRNGEHDT